MGIEPFVITERMREPRLLFVHWLMYFGIGLITAAIPCFLFHTVKDLEVQENLPLYGAVLAGAALLLTVAYHAFAVYGARRYKERSDVLDKTFTEAEVNKKINDVLRMGRVFSFAVVNTAYVVISFLISLPRFGGRFEITTAFALTTALPASALAFIGSALL